MAQGRRPNRDYIPALPPGSVTLKTLTIRNFDGGWNVIDNDLNLDLKFSKLQRNVYRGQDGAIAIRWGTRLFADLAAVTSSPIINMEAFNGFIVAFTADGQGYSVDSTAVVRRIWSPTIAAALPGAPAGWGPITFCSFAASNGNLVVTDGIDKPLVISSVLATTFLQDVAVGSNAFVPRAKYARAHGSYLLMAGDPSAPSTLYIGAKGTTGTFVGAPPPNDAITIDLGPRVPTGDKTIRGIGRYRDKAIILFAECAIVATLGIYDAAGNHTPSFDETLDLYGAVSHRTIQTFGEEFLFTDNVGVATLTRALFNTTLRPERVSQLIDPEVQASMGAVDTQSLIDRSFSIQNRLEGQYMLFVPNNSQLGLTSETRCFVFTNIVSLKISHWAEFRGWNWSSACRSAAQRVYFSKGTQIYIYGTLQDPIYGDFIGDQETWSDDTQFTDGTGLTTTSTQTDSGVPITFDWQLPWTDMKRRLNAKNTRYLAMDTIGTALFNVETFVDNFLVDPSNLGELFTDGTGFTDGFGWTTPNPAYTPALTWQMAGGDRVGFGGDGFGQVFGGGRPSRNEQLYGWKVKGKLFKLRVWGDTREQLRIVSITLGYNPASVQR